MREEDRTPRILSKVNEKYELLEILGEGAFGIVRKCRNRETGQYAACKTIDKTRVENVIQLSREIELLKEVHHPHIIELFDIYDDDDDNNAYNNSTDDENRDTANDAGSGGRYLHLITELCTGGELYDKVIAKAEASEDGHCFQEDDAAILLRDILDAIRYIHDELHIVHRDLKPENFLLSTDSDDTAEVKIIDFGLSRRDNAPFGIMTSRVGTPYYVAPEVLYQSYSSKCDIWSIGVIGYILLCGFCPFAGETDLETLNLVKVGKLEFPSPEWDDISDDAKDFLSLLLTRDPEARPSAAEAMEHPWIARFVVPSRQTSMILPLKGEEDSLEQFQPEIPSARPFQKRISSSSVSASDRKTVRNTSGYDTAKASLSASTRRPRSLSNEERRAISSSTATDIRLDGARATAFQKFLAASKVKKAMNMSVQELSQSEALHLAKIFAKVDQDGDGKISVEDLEEATYGGQQNKFSSSVRRQLGKVKHYMVKKTFNGDPQGGNKSTTESGRKNSKSSSRMKLDVRPFLKLIEKRAKSEEGKLKY